jgi:hypothetical protein
MKCHPDRTKRKELHEIFKKAYQAYRINDMNTMQDLWNEVQYITGHIKAMMDRIEELRKDLSSCNVEYTQLVTATAGQLLMLFENEDTREIADSKFLDHTRELREKILLQLEQLRVIHSQTGRATIFRTFT